MDVTIPAGFDFTDPDLFEKRLPHDEWRQLRRTQPIHRVDKRPGSDGFDDDHYWLVTRHADVKEISRLTGEIFSAGENTMIPRFAEGTPREIIEAQRAMLVNEDGEIHKKHRRIISRGFTPRGVAGMRDELADRARKIVTAAAESNADDFVTSIASELPLQAIADLLGVPQEDRHKIFEWSNIMTSYDAGGDPDAPAIASMELIGYANAMAEDRAANPRDDIVTKLVQADVDGEHLSAEEFGWFVTLLAVAGNETTRNATTHGMVAMLEHPEQWELFKRERPETAYDEILRWASPITQFQRTAMEDTEIGGVSIAKGDRVLICYGSANFDEEVFDDPFTFTILRDPNPHVTFGGQGPHYCLGANLAKMQLELIFNAVADHLPDLTALGDPKRLRSGWLNGLTEWKVDLGVCPVAS
ncbi:steroid C27-monooxygenase [Dietzia sp. HMSC21D01]|uniref:Cytochrome P450 n=2 Tax=Dietzia TaxID=37914 RepID=A0AAW5Q3Z9_9ACTN|nr:MULTISPECIES: cytochrome P450 [Dietzia]AHE80548.1 cytochrome P450 monooxygenase [Dietzia sp. D5]PWD97348.1 cytochrome P450 [Dietzia maris]MCT1639057.1 cytochrome P450 [Dietzia cinnamea]MCT1862999.1 cytochrome P450 [Dietzia cinnamea]MCT1884513.1 cytochrome P450 [Dietzia cinnamea]